MATATANLDQELAMAATMKRIDRKNVHRVWIRLGLVRVFAILIHAHCGVTSVTQRRAFDDADAIKSGMFGGDQHGIQ